MKNFFCVTLNDDRVTLDEVTSFKAKLFRHLKENDASLILTVPYFIDSRTNIMHVDYDFYENIYGNKLKSLLHIASIFTIKRGSSPSWKISYHTLKKTRWAWPNPNIDTAYCTRDNGQIVVTSLPKYLETIS